MQNNIKIFVCTHKPFYIFKNDVLKPIHVGKQLSYLNLGYDGDDTGDNISYKNTNYCELTALYWVWKNYTETEFVGLCHYRRFFNFDNEKIESLYESDLVHKNDLFKLSDVKLKSNEIITPYPLRLNCSVLEHYKAIHNIDDLLKVRASIQKFYPTYLDTFDLTMEQSILYPYNMIITNKVLLDSYCGWLFRILFNSEKNINISSNPYQMRVFGFLSERLFTVWLLHNNKEIKIKHLPIIYIESDLERVNNELVSRSRKEVYSSNSYKLGNFILLPFKLLKRIFR